MSNSIFTIRHLVFIASSVLGIMLPGCLPDYHLQKGSISGLFMESPVVFEPGGKPGGVQVGIPLTAPFVTKASFSDNSFLEAPGKTTGEKNVFHTYAPYGTGLSASFAPYGIFITQFDGKFAGMTDGAVCDLNLGVGIRLYNDRYCGRIVFNFGLVGSLMDVHIIKHDESGYYDYRGRYFKPFTTYGLSYSFNSHPGRFIADPIVQLGGRYGAFLSYEKVHLDQLDLGLHVGIGKSLGNWQLLGAVGVNLLTGLFYSEPASYAIIPTGMIKITHCLPFSSP